MGAPVKIGALRDKHDVRADLLRLQHRHDVCDTEAFGFLGAGDHTGVDGRGKRHDADRPAPQARANLLLHGCKEAVEIEIKPLYGFRLAHHSPLKSVMSNQ